MFLQDIGWDRLLVSPILSSQEQWQCRSKLLKLVGLEFGEENEDSHTLLTITTPI